MAVVALFVICATVLVRHLLKAPTPTLATLKRRGIPNEPGAWDEELVCA